MKSLVSFPSQIFNFFAIIMLSGGLPSGQNPVSYRHNALKLLCETVHLDFLIAREIESRCHACAGSIDEYTNNIKLCAFNARHNANAGVDMLSLHDTVLARGTIVEKLRNEAKARETRFQEMLEDKYESMNDEKFQSIVKCRRCGSTEVRWEEKQTRSADEGATVFCTCINCQHRWVLR